ncbi:MAG TPA: hypothetical protein VGZ91_11125 [Candidatus Sulfotelmatobacter sp.]|jgi:hypothetical protein|nr:hypothetical protein [Candidatus Sulfotelmatobacter sp.]
MDATAKKIWVTLTGLPLTIELEWPFHRSTSGADFWVLHGDVRLEGSDGLHAPMAVNLSATVREVMASLEPKDAEAPVINALRKEVDKRQIEFLKSGKLKPVAFSSRHYDFKRGKWVFGKASDDEIATFVERKVYWETKLKSPLLAKDARNGAPKIWIGDPTDAQYLETTPAHLLEITGRLVAGDGLVRIDREWAEATSGLMGQAERFEAAMRTAVEELEKKHAFERG